MGDAMPQTNHMTNYQFTIALMVFIVAYCIFEAPSNLALKVFTPNRHVKLTPWMKLWLGFLVFSFGAICCGIAGTTNFAGVTALRFFLGAAEAGIFPGMIFFMSFWYKPEERATRIAIFLCSATLAGAFGGQCLRAIAYGVRHMNRTAGLVAWCWLFIIEGLPSVLVGILVFFFMPNYPENASWLTQTEKAIQRQRLASENSSHGEAKINWKDAKATLKDVKLWVHYSTYLAAGSGATSLSLFSPVIVAGLGYHDLRAQLFTVPPYAIAYVVTLVVALWSDNRQMRGHFACAGFSVAAISFLILAAIPGTHYGVCYFFLILATSGCFSALPPLCTWVGDNARSTTGGSLATALNVASSGPGQIIGIWIYRAQDAPLHKLGHGVNAASQLIGASVTLGLYFHYKKLNRKLTGTNATRWIA
ncbi:uncharacterized protein Z519_10746 [Cladophialophora bantiana CBS 173.52]|uniref:Major facilitator superfamily (MFS) profile domain-containing protein n=1 Tax=Cladophialophora bantiana (strain ATCC 10958 / CBS 173.52 / CDC B-1940 / NIH 8579) TaxID=1442370 RepID=A0A0D2HCR7_CLAB1|nr:uncharacterized protein Z519_10746 [Cladophialophora bantiana CBS 173.52]KIW88700.1 hypothetical protein Z519_10746 [Cladophialophora bantiana CBS 173.52]